MLEARLLAATDLCLNGDPVEVPCCPIVSRILDSDGHPGTSRIAWMFPPEQEITRPTKIDRPRRPAPPAHDTRPTRDPARRRGCLLPGLVLVLAAATYFFIPFRTNVLILGTDRRPGQTSAARTDTIILTTIVPARPYIGMLSIPRDLWVEVPGFGPNRINAAYFLAEGREAGSGAAAAVDTVSTNFGVDVDAHVTIEFTGFVRFVDALGGVTLDLDLPMGGYPAGTHRLDGTQALAFVRDRTGDDFFRMQNGHALLRGLLRTMASPASWPQWPLAAPALLTAVETDLPAVLWPRLALAVLRAGSPGIDAQAIGREMVHGFTTEGGAQVLAPDWSQINPVLLEMFGQ